MIEVWSIIVLCLTSIVTATPYGYGVKGGASAKAEANAAAGAFAGIPAIPLSIPSGPGFSGSFSKSSSSSFASSSASSSSSSSSFSFSGAGANDLRVNGGCSGGCPNKGTNDGTLTSNGEFDSSYKNDENKAGNAAATAGQEIRNLPKYSKTNNQPCEGANCNEYGKTLKCSSGQCPKDISSESDEDSEEVSISQDVPCTSSDCKQGLSKQIDSENDSNDIKINVAGNSAHNYGSKLSNLEGNSKTDKTTNDCYNGNCYASLPQTIQPPNAYGNNNIRGPTPNTEVGVTPKCRTPNCDPYNPISPTQGTTAPGYYKPLQQLLTPNYGPVCTTYPCPSPPSGAPNNNGKLPTNDNVPISAVPGPSSIPQNKNTQCLSGPCLNNDDNHNLPVSPSVGPTYGAPSDSNFPVTCTTGTCTSFNSGHITNPSYSTTSYSHGIKSGHYPSQTSGSSLCQGPNCYKPSLGINGNQPSLNIPYNCGTGSIAGCSHNPDAATTGLVGQPGRHTDIPRLGHTVGPNIQPEYTGFKAQPQNINTQSGYPGLIKDSGIYNADDIHNHNAFNPNAPRIPTPNSGLVPPTINYPANSGSYVSPNLPSANSRPGIPLRPFDSSKPNTGVPQSDENIPSNSGTFGALPNSYGGSSKPSNENGVPNSISPGSYSLSPGSPNFGSHPPSSGVELSKPNNFGPSQYYPSYANAPSGGSAFLPASPKPGYTNLPKSIEEKEKLPYTGGFGGPSGFLKPNDYSLPAKIPTSPVVHKSDSCSAGDCSPKSYKTTIGGQSALSNAGTASATASANAKATAYTGGFGGPPGFLKPNDNEKPVRFVPLNGKGSPDFVTAPQYGHSADKSGNGNFEQPRNEGDGSSGHNNANAVAQASAVASANAGALSNNNQSGSKGCSLCTAPNNVNGANGNYGSTGLANAGIDGDYSNTNNAGAVATAKSVANASAGSYGLGGNFASSSASAHASAGVPRKGGYGRR